MKTLLIVTLGAAIFTSACRTPASDADLSQDPTSVAAPAEPGAAAAKTTDIALDATKATVGQITETSKAVAATTGQVVTDGWMTTTLKARFVDEILLKGSDIKVDTHDRVITLKGTVASDAAKTRAVVLARRTEGVTHVVNQLVVREN